MCGIFGMFTGKEEALGPILFEAAQRLTYRVRLGRSATLSWWQGDLRKMLAGSREVSVNITSLRCAARGITQLRWATSANRPGQCPAAH